MSAGKQPGSGQAQGAPPGYVAELDRRIAGLSAESWRSDAMRRGMIAGLELARALYLRQEPDAVPD